MNLCFHLKLLLVDVQLRAGKFPQYLLAALLWMDLCFRPKGIFTIPLVPGTGAATCGWLFNLGIRSRPYSAGIWVCTANCKLIFRWLAGRLCCSERLGKYCSLICNCFLHEFRLHLNGIFDSSLIFRNWSCNEWLAIRFRYIPGHTLQGLGLQLELPFDVLVNFPKAWAALERQFEIISVLYFGSILHWLRLASPLTV